MFPGCNDKITDGQEEPYYLGSQGCCKYLPLNIDNKWQYDVNNETSHYDSYGFLIESTYTETSETNTVIAEPTDPLVNNYWALNMVGALICWHNGVYNRNINYDPKYIIGDDIQVGDQTESMFLSNVFPDNELSTLSPIQNKHLNSNQNGQNNPPVVEEIIDTLEVPAGVFHNVLRIHAEYSWSYEEMSGDSYGWVDVDEYWAEGVGMIFGDYYEKTGQWFHNSTSVHMKYALKSYELH